MNFLQFAVWGSYLTSMGSYLDDAGMASHIGMFYAMQGIVSIFMPAVIGIIADRWVQAQRLLGICHALAALFMGGGWFYASNAGDGVMFAPLFALYSLSVAFYMPTVALSYSVAYSVLERNGLDPVKAFPPVRVWGTVGFICSMLLCDFSGFQMNSAQFLQCAVLGLALAAYAMTLPACPVDASANKKGMIDALGLRAFTLFKDSRMAMFFIFSILLGVSLQITNSYGTTFIEHFKNVEQYANDFFASNSVFLISLSQCSEALCILLIPMCLRRFGIKGVMLIAMMAWVLRFGFFGIGDTSTSGVGLLMLSCVVYGVAFDFFNVSGGLYVDQQTSPEMRSSAQGLFMIMTNGIGASLGTWIAGTFVINKKVFVPGLDAVQQLDGWRESWFIFAAYALLVAVLFFFIFKEKKTSVTDSEIAVAEHSTTDPVD